MVSQRFFLVCALLSVSIAPGVLARTWHVDVDGSGDAPTIQAAIDSAIAGDVVLLAPGTYTWSAQGGVSSGPLVVMKAGVTLASLNGPETTVISVWASASSHAVHCNDVGSQCVIEGITFEGSDDRSAIYVVGASEPQIRNCVFRDNFVGLDGAAISCDVATIEDCTFIRNRIGSGRGGAIACGATRISRCRFFDNRAGTSEGIGSGGAIASISAWIEDCHFENNNAYAFGGPSRGGAIYDPGNPVIERCSFLGNFATGIYSSPLGGAVFCGDGTIEDCLFLGNQTYLDTSRGGAVYAPGGVTVSRSAFVGNISRGTAGTIWVGSDSDISQCTLLANEATGPDAVGGIVAPSGSVRNLILAWTRAGTACAGNATWSCSNVFGNIAGNEPCGIDGGGNFSADPEFCAVEPIESQNFTVQGDSPCAPGKHPDGLACGLIGAGPVGCGSVNVTNATWSLVKDLYR